jgi:hypothetical protein
MTSKGTGSVEVRPNTLQGQAAPNTFRSQAGPGTYGKQELNSGGGNAGPRALMVRPQVRRLVFVVLAVVVVVIVLYALSVSP